MVGVNIQGAFYDNFLGYRVSDFVGNSRTQKINKAQTKQVHITGLTFQYNLQVSTGVVSTLSYPFYYLLFALTPTICPSPADVASAIRRYNRASNKPFKTPSTLLCSHI